MSILERLKPISIEIGCAPFHWGFGVNSNTIELGPFWIFWAGPDGGEQNAETDD